MPLFWVTKRIDPFKISMKHDNYHISLNIYINKILMSVFG
jgi:hypothetical protein